MFADQDRRELCLPFSHRFVAEDNAADQDISLRSHKASVLSGLLEPEAMGAEAR